MLGIDHTYFCHSSLEKESKKSVSNTKKLLVLPSTAIAQESDHWPSSDLLTIFTVALTSSQEKPEDVWKRMEVE